MVGLGFLQTLISLVLSVYDWFICWEILLDFQGGVVLRLGKFHRMALPGWNWRLPFGIEAVMLTNVVPTTADLPPQAIVTQDGHTVLVESVILWGVKSPKKFLLEVESGVTVLTEAGMAVIYDVVAEHTWMELQTTDIDHEMTAAVRKRAWKWGVEVYSVQINSMSRLGLRDGCLRIANPGQLMAAG